MPFAGTQPPHDYSMYAHKLPQKGQKALGNYHIPENELRFGLYFHLFNELFDVQRPQSIYFAIISDLY